MFDGRMFLASNNVQCLDSHALVTSSHPVYKRLHLSSIPKLHVAAPTPCHRPCIATRPQTAAARPTVFYRTSAQSLVLHLHYINSNLGQFNPTTTAAQSIRQCQHSLHSLKSPPTQAAILTAEETRPTARASPTTPTQKKSCPPSPSQDGQTPKKTPS